MSNLTLSAAAAAILNEENADSILKKSVASSGSEKFGLGKTVSADEQGKEDLGSAGKKTTDANYDPTKKIKKATPPGATPPVGSEPMKKLSGEPQQSMGRSDLAVSPEKETTKTISNKGVKESDEDLEDLLDDEETEEATEEEVVEDLENMDNETFQEKYGMSKDDAISYMIEADDEREEEGEEEDEEAEDEDEKAEAKKAKKEAEKAKMKEDIDAMLSGENLSEGFKDKASVIFEAAVQSRVDEVALELEERFTKEFENSLEAVKEDFAEKLDSYLDYVVENWMAENELAIEKGLRAEIVEDFIGALRNVFVEHYIDIPEDEVNVVEGLVEKVESLEEQVNEQISKNIQLKQKLSEHKKKDVINSVCEGLTLSQAEKIKSLAENVEFVSEKDFSNKIEMIKESYFPSEIKPATVESLNDSIEIEEGTATKVVDPIIESYAQTIAKLTKF